MTYQMEAQDFPIASDAIVAYESAYGAAQKALTLDEADYQAHISLAWPLLFHYRHDYERMKKHVDRPFSSTLTMPIPCDAAICSRCMARLTSQLHAAKRLFD